MARMAQNEMRAMRAMPWRVRSTEYKGTSRLPAKVGKHQDWSANFNLNLKRRSPMSEITRWMLLIVRVGVDLA